MLRLSWLRHTCQRCWAVLVWWFAGYEVRDIITGLFAYGLGDVLASYTQGLYSPTRMVGMTLVGAILYSREIPWIFSYINRPKVVLANGIDITALVRAFLAVCYFSPLWIMRHMFFMRWFSVGWNKLNLIDIQLSAMGTFSNAFFLSFGGNLVIHNVVPFRWRLLASGCFSAIMACYYAWANETIIR